MTRGIIDHQEVHDARVDPLAKLGDEVRQVSALLFPQPIGQPQRSRSEVNSQHEIRPIKTEPPEGRSHGSITMYGAVRQTRLPPVALVSNLRDVSLTEPNSILESHQLPDLEYEAIEDAVFSRQGLSKYDIPHMQLRVQLLNIRRSPSLQLCGILPGPRGQSGSERRHPPQQDLSIRVGSPTNRSDMRLGLSRGSDSHARLKPTVEDRFSVTR
jgi:hypothetical protein